MLWFRYPQQLLDPRLANQQDVLECGKYCLRLNFSQGNNQEQTFGATPLELRGTRLGPSYRHFNLLSRYDNPFQMFRHLPHLVNDYWFEIR